MIVEASSYNRLCKSSLVRMAVAELLLCVHRYQWSQTAAELRALTYRLQNSRAEHGWV